MQNIDKDLEFAIEKVLCGTWKERKEVIDKVFVEDATFWYTLCLIIRVQYMHTCESAW